MYILDFEKSFASFIWPVVCFCFAQGLRPCVPAESPTMIFATPTKLVSEAGATVEYMGASKINELQKLFQVMKNTDWIKVFVFFFFLFHLTQLLQWMSFC